MVGDKCVECRWLEESAYNGRAIYRCGRGHFDQGGITHYYALSGLTRPNKAIREIQADCLEFERRVEA